MSLPPSLVTVDASEPIEKINEIIARDGGVIVANFLPQQLINKSTKDGELQSISDIRRIRYGQPTKTLSQASNTFADKNGVISMTISR